MSDYPNTTRTPATRSGGFACAKKKPGRAVTSSGLSLIRPANNFLLRPFGF